MTFLEWQTQQGRRRRIREAQLVLAMLALLACVGAAFAGRWDGSFARVGQVSSTSPTSANVAVTAGSYVKVRCDAAAYIGHGEGSSTVCTSTTCDKVTGGDPFYAQLTAPENYVAVLAVTGTATCQVFRSKN